MEYAVVTGASAGIGEAVARRLLERGLNVIALQRGEPRLRHPGLIHRSVDLSDPQATREVAQSIAAEFSVGYLVNNAGANCPALFEDATIEELRYVTDITLGAALVLGQAFVPAMRRARFGRIVNISSRAVLGKKGRTVYSSVKAGLIGMTRTLAIEVGRDGITVNAVVPGPVATDHFNRGHPHGSEQRKRVIQDILVGRIGEPDDVANAVDFLLAPASGYITGQSLFVCGGTSLTGTGGE
jgi:NAD(P)-dependent dehydrogenase (short-subunit alcohol dehydrogenase family)